MKQKSLIKCLPFLLVAIVCLISINLQSTYGQGVKQLGDDTSFGKPLPNYTLEDAIPVTGDELFGKVRWSNRNNLDELKGKSIMLQVHIRE